jgi:peptidoglycan/LPS O-acetylase OafA/YrhL
VAAGLVSYGIYLWHEAWIEKLLAWSHRPPFSVGFAALTVGVAACTAVAAGASYVLVEQPFQRLGRRRTPALVRPTLEPATG